MAWQQLQVTLTPKRRGVHLVTREILAGVDLTPFAMGLLHLFLTHTSASLSVNENASPEVREDFERFFRRAVPDGASYFEHRLEGPDDMPAHIKTSLMGSGLLLPIVRGRLALGNWQGIYLCEHRERAGPRRVVITIHGELDKEEPTR